MKKFLAEQNSANPFKFRYAMPTLRYAMPTPVFICMKEIAVILADQIWDQIVSLVIDSL